MKATFISKEGNNAKFTMEFSAEEFEAAIIKAYQETKEKYVIDGFRKGKAPRKLIEAHYGEGVFFEDAIDALFSENYGAAIDELKLDVIDRPAMEFSQLKKGEGFTVTITVETYPEFEVSGYKGVEVTKTVKEITDEDVQKDIEAIQKRNSKMVLVERPAKEGDTVLLDYKGFVGEDQFEGGTAERFELKLGSGMFIPGFEEQLVGVSAGESKDVVVTFPTEYHSADLAGKEAVFKCLLHEIKEEQFDEINDDFAKDVSEFDTLEELKADTKTKLEKQAEEVSTIQVKNDALEAALAANDIDVPNVMVEEEIDHAINEFDQQLRYQGLTVENYLQYIQKELSDFRNEIKDDCTKRVKTRMLLSKIAEQENIEVSEEDFEKQIEMMAAQYNLEPEKVKEMLGESGRKMVEGDLKLSKAFDFVYDNANVKEA